VKKAASEARVTRMKRAISGNSALQRLWAAAVDRSPHPFPRDVTPQGVVRLPFEAENNPS
jgi:hypothetical protein